MLAPFKSLNLLTFLSSNLIIIKTAQIANSYTLDTLILASKKFHTFEFIRLIS